MDQGQRNPEDQVHLENLDNTLKELQRKVKQHENELQKLRPNQYEVSESPAAQAKVLKTAFDEVTNSDPFLPYAGSVLPALLALRKTSQTIQDSKAYLASQSTTTDSRKRQLEVDRGNLKDQHLLTGALKARIASLQEELKSKAQMRPEDGARERVEELKRKKKSYDRETSQLMKALLWFIDRHLAAMLAAEELGGPVVGDLMDVDADDLAAGFNAQGKLKKVKGDANQDKRQRRIDEIWGNADQQDGQGGQNDEVTAAGVEMRQLMEELLNRLVEGRGNTSESYVKLSRESAASRFLVRSKVAQLHPKDATRVKLTDFGRELED